MDIMDFSDGSSNGVIMLHGDGHPGQPWQILFSWHAPRGIINLDITVLSIACIPHANLQC